jgi:hypothetical protein
MTGIINIFNKHIMEVSPKWLGVKVGKNIQRNEDFIHANYHLPHKYMPPMPFAKENKSSIQRVHHLNDIARKHVEKRSGAKGLEQYYNSVRIHGGKPGRDVPDSIGMYRLGKQVKKEGRVKRGTSADSLKKSIKKLDDAIKRMNMGR